MKPGSRSVESNAVTAISSTSSQSSAVSEISSYRRSRLIRRKVSRNGCVPPLAPGSTSSGRYVPSSSIRASRRLRAR